MPRGEHAPPAPGVVRVRLQGDSAADAIAGILRSPGRGPHRSRPVRRRPAIPHGPCAPSRERGQQRGRTGGRAMSWLDDLQASDPAYPAPGTSDLWQAPPTADWATLASPPEPEAEL
jgi:hypothetical protein